MIATFLQLLGLTSIIVGASMEYGTPGGIAATGVAAVYVGLAMEGEH